MSVDSPQPLGPADVFQRGFGLWWRNFRPMALVTLAVTIPLQILGTGLLLLTFPGYLESLENYPEMIESLELSAQNSGSPEAAMQQYEAMMGMGTGGGGFTMMIIVQLVSMLISVVMIALVFGATTRIAASAASGSPVTWREGLATAMDRLWALAAGQVIILILLGVLAVVTFFLLGLPALWLGVAWCLFFPVILFDRLPVFEALSRSFRLIRTRWWPTFGTLLLALIVQFVIIVLLIAPYIAGLLLGWPLALSLALAIIGGLVTSVVAYPMTASVVTSIYLDLRLRKEGVVPEAGAGDSIEWRQVVPPTEPPAAPPSPPSS